LADGGKNPLTGELVVQPDVVTQVLSVMITCGLYDFSGEWMFRTGLPAKSGVGGGIAVVLPGQFGIGTFSPRLDAQGNSVRGVLACEAVSRQFGLHVMRPRLRGASPIHRRLNGAEVHSRRARPARERAVLSTAADLIMVYELQGDVTFGEAESVSRQAASEAVRWLIMDAARVERVDPAAAAVLQATVSALAERGVRVLLTGGWDEAAITADERHPSVADAIEACEDVLVAEAGLPHLADEIPLADNDLCRSLTSTDLAALAEATVTLRFAPGEVINDSAASAHPIMFITRGCLDLERAVGAGRQGDGSPLRFSSRSAGTAVGAQATFDTSGQGVRLVARTEVAVEALSAEAMVRLHDDQPQTIARLYRAAAEALAAEYRWTAAENVALTR
jgi:glutaminase